MNIKEKRLKAKLSQQQLADKTGIPKDRIGKWEQGKGKPKAEDSSILEKFFRTYNAEEQVPHETAVSEPSAHYIDEPEKLSLEKSIENLTQNELKTTTIIETLTQNESRNISIIERLVAILERKYSELTPATAATSTSEIATSTPTLSRPGTQGTVTRNPRKEREQAANKKAGT